jgi:hypothetical protein
MTLWCLAVHLARMRDVLKFWHLPNGQMGLYAGIVAMTSIAGVKLLSLGDARDVNGMNPQLPIPFFTIAGWNFRRHLKLHLLFVEHLEYLQPKFQRF